MSTIILRANKGSKLTSNEVDQNFTNLNNDKLEVSQFSGNSTILIKNSSGTFAVAEIAEGRIVGRLVDGQIKGLTAAELLGILGIDISKVQGLQAALDGKQQVITADAGWNPPTGVSSRASFDVYSVSTLQLAARVKAIYEALVAVGILEEGT